MNTPSSLPSEVLSGTHAEIGFQHGERLRGRIERSLEVYRRYFSERYGLSWKAAVDAAPRYFNAIRAHHEPIAREIEGIAEGSGRSLNEIVVLNARTEMLYEVSNVFQEDGKRLLEGEGPGRELDFGECTAVGVGPPSAAGEDVWVGQTWDWIPATLETAVWLRIRPAEGPALVTLTEAGIVGKIGANEHRLALCFNLLGSSVNRVGVPAHVLAREVLNSHTLSGAVKRIADADPAGGANFLMGSADGDVLNVEVCPVDFNVRYATEGILTHTNHYLDPPRGARDRVKALKNVNQSTWLRQGRSHRLLGSRDRPLDRSDLAEVLSDHGDAPESICRHPDPDSPMDLATNLAVIFDLKRQRAQHTVGPPCRSEYRRVDFDWSGAEPGVETTGPDGFP